MPTGHQQALINLICMTLSEVDNLLQTAFFEGEKTGNGELDSNDNMIRRGVAPSR